MRELIYRLISHFKQEEIESEAIRVFIDDRDIDINNIVNVFLRNHIINENIEIRDLLRTYKERWEICDLINLFECLVSEEEKQEHGVVFTPRYIVEYIIENTINQFNIDYKIIDPSCGCGAFLCVLVQKLSDELDRSIIDIIENNIYGLDIIEDHVRRTKLLLSIIALINGEDQENIRFNILEMDSLRNSWNNIFGINKFNYIVGNPPYVNTHDMNKDNIKYLKKNFETTKIGTFNIFYAFIEQSMKYLDNDGRLGFIIPNNFITIDAAKYLRRYLIENKYLEKMIDFNLNLAFNPVKSYNAIIFLDKQEKDRLLFSKLPFNNDIGYVLRNAEFEEIQYNDLREDIWHLMNNEDRQRVNIIENIGHKLDKRIRTGIATLKDAVYKFTPNNDDDNFYYMSFNNCDYAIEKEATRSIVKISDVNNEQDIINCRDRIIFPYEFNEEIGKFTVIPEDKMEQRFPMALAYLKEQRNILETRSDQNKLNVWYEYGRSQGLNNYGTKLIHPTFSGKPKFMVDENPDRLFVNGYAIFTDGIWDAKILQKILNSNIMDFYIKNTSYSLEGGYRCYQKKYFKNFSIPELTDEQKEFIRNEQDRDVLDRYICDIYGLDI